MTVQQLIEWLSTQDPTATVQVLVSGHHPAPGFRGYSWKEFQDLDKEDHIDILKTGQILLGKIHAEMQPRERTPTTPGELLQKNFLNEMSITPIELAQLLNLPVSVVNGLLNGTVRITQELATKLGAIFQTTPDYWLNAQRAVDLHEF
jgi:addiction module HigA family antidote